MLRSMETRETFWERNTQNRWSQYLLGIEEDIVLRTLERFEQPGKAIEVGCDGGKWSTLLHSLGWDVTCVDIDPDALAICRQRLPDAKIVFADPEATTYEIDGDQFDFLFAIQVPPSQEPWFAREAARLLKPGALAVFDVINAASYRAYLSLLRSMVSRDELFYTCRFADVQKDYEAEGFEFLETIGYAWAPFSRDSNSLVIPFVTGLEKCFGLRGFSRYAPWVISSVKFHADKNANLLEASCCQEMLPCAS